MRDPKAPLLAGLLALALLGCGEPPPRLLLLITADTLRSDRLGAYGSPLGLTPALDRLARHSARFEHAFTPVPLTLPALTSLMTGHYPQESGVRSNVSVLPAHVETLASILRSHGWRTAAVVSSFILDPRTGIDRGFERYDHDLPEQERNRGLPERVGPDTSAAAIRMLDALDPTAERPLFLWVHYQDAHGPYTAPEECRAPAGAPPPGVRDRSLPVSPDDRGEGAIPRYQLLGSLRESARYRAAYHGEIRCLDRAIGSLLAELRRRGLFGQAVVVFAADHGEDLGERDSWFAHGARLTRAETHVPLLVHVPGRAPEERQDVASLLDVAPTLLRLAGVQAPVELRGRDLFGFGARYRESSVYLAVPRGTGSFPRHGLVSGGYRYVRTERPVLVLERLRRIGEPLRELSGAEPERTERMRERLARWRAQLAGLPQERRFQISPETHEALRALGYAR